MSEGTAPRAAFDAAVVGAGMVGSGCALFLATRGLRVAVLDAGAAGSGTSERSFAWINATSKVTDERYHRLNALGAQGYRDLAAAWGEERIGLHPSGMLQWAGPDDAVAMTGLARRYERLREWGYPIAWVERPDLAALEPHVEFAPGARGLHAIADAWLDVGRFVGFATEQVVATGGAVLEHAAAREILLGDAGEVQGVRTEHGEIRAPRLIVAAGPSTPEVLGALTGYPPYATRFPMRHAPGLLVRTPPTTPWHLARRILYTTEHGSLHVRPTGDGGLLLGADDTDGPAARPEDASGLRDAARTLLERACSLFPRFPGPTLLDRCELKIGVRPMPADGHSIVGTLPGSDGLYVALTHSGVTLAPALGRLLAEEIVTGERPAELHPFTFDRFQAP